MFRGHPDVVDADLSDDLDPSSHCTSICCRGIEEVGKRRGHLDSKAFPPSDIDVHGVQFAALYTLQDRLARDAEPVNGFEHRHVVFRRILHEARAQFVVKSEIPPAANGGLRSHVPARPRCITPRIEFLFIATPLWLRLLSDPASRRRPCRSPDRWLCDCLEQGLPPCTSRAMRGTHAQVNARTRQRRGRRVEPISGL